MPGFNSDVLPSTPNLKCGSPTQPWTFYGTLVGVQELFGSAKLVIQSTSPLIINGSNATVIEIDMSSSVLASTFTTNTSPGACQFLLFRIVQDVVGGWAFTWPPNFYGGAPIDNVNISMTSNQVAQQMFLYDANAGAAYAMGPATYVP